MALRLTGTVTSSALRSLGEVTAVGNEVTGLAVGDRVMGIVGGGMAATIPTRMSFIEAAAVMESFVTGWEALAHLGRTEKKRDRSHSCCCRRHRIGGSPARQSGWSNLASHRFGGQHRERAFAGRRSCVRLSAVGLRGGGRRCDGILWGRSDHRLCQRVLPRPQHS